MSPVLKCSNDTDKQRNRSSVKTLVFWREKMRKEMVETLLQLGLLNTAVEKGSLEIVEYLLKYGADVNMLVDDCSTGLTPLHRAVKRKQVEMARLLIYYGAYINVEDSKKKFPLTYAIENKDIKMIELLLNNGIDIEKDSSSLRIAVVNGCLKFAEILLKYGANVNLIDNLKLEEGVTLLHSAVLAKQMEMAKLLINYGANVNFENFLGETPIVHAIRKRDTKMTELLLINGADMKGVPMVLISAVKQGNMKIVEDLLKYGADVNMLVNDYKYRGITLLHAAVYRKHVEMAKLLINYGANVNVKNREGKAPIIYSIENRDTKMTELLLIKGADIKGDPNIPFTAVKHGNLKIVEDLLKDGADVNMIDKSQSSRGGTLLHSAVLAKQVEMAKLLINYGACVNVQDWLEITPIGYAIANGDTKMTDLLLVNGYDTKKDPKSLCIAVEKGSLKIAEDLLKDGADVNLIDKSRWIIGVTILHIAVFAKQMEMSKLLINYGANVNVKDSNGDTPIVYAIRKRDTKMTEMLIINGADIKKDPRILCTAVKKGSLKVVEDLLKDGADVNLIDNSKSRGGVTLLHSAVLAKQVEMAKLLINYGAYVNVKDGHGTTPLGYAMLKSNTEMIELLLINGADIKEDPRILCTAVKNGSLKVVEDLLKDGADVNLIDNSKLIGGVTLLHSAVLAKQMEMAKLLINYGANVNVEDSRGKTPIDDAMLKNNTEMTELLSINGADIKVDPMLLCTAVENGNLKIVEYLLKRGADVNLIYNSKLLERVTLLHSAVLAKQVDMAKLLINYGANVNVKNREGNAPIIYSIENRDTKMTELLLIKGADIKGDPDIPFTAVKHGNLKIVEDLLKDGADVNMIDKSQSPGGATLLHSAVLAKQVEITTLLINYGACVNAKDDNGTTPLGYAIENRDTKMTELLLINGADIKEDPMVLISAVKQGVMKIVEDLLKYGADVNMLVNDYKFTGLTPLHAAVYRKQVEMAKLLINYGANVNVKNREGKAPIIYSIENRDTKMTELLLIKGADIKGDPNIPFTAVKHGNLKIVEDLLKDGADVNMIDKSQSSRGGTLLHSAVLAKQVEMAKLLINYGACVNVQDRLEITPIGYAIENGDTKMTDLLLVNGYDTKKDPKSLSIAVGNKNLKFAEVLLKYAADVNLLNSPPFNHYHFLLCAVRTMQVEMAKLLINYGANVNVKNWEGKAPIIYSIENRDTKMTELLLIKGADIKGDPNIPFTAVKHGNLKIVEDLLKDGADVNMIDKSQSPGGVTLLHSAVLAKQVEMAKLLINYGAYVIIKDRKGETPIDYAIENGDIKMIELLLINGANMKENLKILCTSSEITIAHS